VEKVSVRNLAIAVFGAWFIVSPFIYGLPGSYTVTAVILGALALIGAVWAMADRQVRTWRAFVGVLVLAMPWVLAPLSGFGVSLWLVPAVAVALVAVALPEALDATAHRTGSSSKAA
jgi:O-antigen ligase